MEPDLDDLNSEWETLRSLPGTKTLAEDINLQGEYMGMGDHPEFVFKLVEESYGLHCMSIWRMKCFGQKRRGRPVYPKMVECWVVQYDVPLWKGARAGLRDRDLGRVFLTPKRDSYTTLAEVTDAFAVARDKAIARGRENILRWKTDIARLEQQIRDEEGSIGKMAALVPRLE